MGWLHEVGRGSSRLLNAVCGTCGHPQSGAGDGGVTFSAASWELAQVGSRFGRLRLRVVDGLYGANHCQEAAAWHRLHGLIPIGMQYDAPMTRTLRGGAVVVETAPQGGTRPKGA